MKQSAVRCCIVRCSTFVLIAAPAAHAAEPAEPWVTVEHTSVLEAYQRFQDEPVRPWSASNKAVGEAGGWRALAKERPTEDAKPQTDDKPGVTQDATPAAPGAEKSP